MKYIAEENIQLLDALSKLSPNSSKTTLRSWIKEGRVNVDGLEIKLSNHLVAKGETVTVGPKRKIIEDGVEVVFEDRDLIIIDKPSGLLSVASNFEKGETAHAILKRYYGTLIQVVHRLDQETSGIMAFARNEKAAVKMKEMFEAHDLKRCYLGIIEGSLETPSGTWTNYLYEDSAYIVHATKDPNKGRLAITHYETLMTTAKYSKVLFTLETGRKNQIRVHCQLAGHPIAGDRKYGALSSPFRRLALHAHSLSFIHPGTHKPMSFVSPLPAKLEI